MTEKNTGPDTASSPPTFMTQRSEKVEDAKSAAEKAAAREAEAAQTDDLDIRAAAVVKATNRITEMAGYMIKVNTVIGATLPEFIAKNSLGQIVDLQIGLEKAAADLAEQLKSTAAYISEAREVHLPARLDEDDTRTHTSVAGNRMSRTTRVLASIKSGAKEDAFAWLRKPVEFEAPTAEEAKVIEALRERIVNGEDIDASAFPPRRPKFPWTTLEDGTIGIDEKWNDDAPDYGSLIQPTVNSSSLSALAKELMESGKDMPDDLFNVHTKDGVSITKAAGTKKPPAKKGKK